MLVRSATAWTWPVEARRSHAICGILLRPVRLRRNGRSLTRWAASRLSANVLTVARPQMEASTPAAASCRDGRPAGVCGARDVTSAPPRLQESRGKNRCRTRSSSRRSSRRSFAPYLPVELPVIGAHGRGGHWQLPAGEALSPNARRQSRPVVIIVPPLQLARPITDLTGARSDPLPTARHPARCGSAPPATWRPPRRCGESGHCVRG